MKKAENRNTFDRKPHQEYRKFTRNSEPSHFVGSQEDFDRTFQSVHRPALEHDGLTGKVIVTAEAIRSLDFAAGAGIVTCEQSL